MSTNKYKYIVIPYEGKYEKLVDVKVTVPQKKMKHEYARRFLDYVYLLEEVALCVKDEEYDKAKKKLENLKNSEFMVFKPTKKDDK